MSTAGELLSTCRPPRAAIVEATAPPTRTQTLPMPSARRHGEAITTLLPPRQEGSEVAYNNSAVGAQRGRDAVAAAQVARAPHTQRVLARQHQDVAGLVEAHGAQVALVVRAPPAAVGGA